ncbi:glycoside hydrolase family 31 protein [Chloroflexus sp.]|uniref:glycoside hydrolase family 31 protein n=1 Tax=Chloroflexus sp. TaxID=1904827 RepID=UPI00298EF72E|nr:glycoside hydrolase family 31 protein [Chloroflexus sp.]MDW8403818.1 glycoside hydrolase family 31 protein [Chloroflexus sp.]
MRHELHSPAGTVLIDGAGRMAFFQAGREVLRGLGAVAHAYGTDFRITGVASADVTERQARIHYTTTRPEITLRAEIEATPTGFRFEWAGPPYLHAVRVEWQLDPGRPWYGMGERIFQHWPLDRAPVISDPFEPIDHGRDGTLNIVTPFWLNAAGAALWLEESDGELAVTMDRAGDGLLRITSREAPPPPNLGFDERYAAPGPHLAGHVILAADAPAAFYAALPLLGRPTAAPPRDLFARPIWTTWAHYKMHVTQRDVTDFATQIVARGYPYSVLEIDDRWQRGYGAYVFDQRKFPDPRAMVDELHAAGFKVTLWTPIFFDPADPAFAVAARRGYLIRHPADGSPYLVRWWQGYGGVLDLTNPEAVAWWLSELRALQAETGVDGFKFDAGEANFIPPDAICYAREPRRRYADRYTEFVADHFAYTEVRVGWRGQRRGILFREWDKWSRWGIDNGLHSVLTQALTLSICGFPFVLPDMIGGNAYQDEVPDGELMVRWTQLSALLPTMQFSVHPWQYGAEVDTICRRYAHLHTELAPYLAELVAENLRDGTPLVRPLFWHAPNDEQALRCDDQFLLGARYLVAPVVQPGQRQRDVYLPAGVWRDYWSGATHQGPAVLTDVPAPLDQMPLFERQA